MHRLLFASAIAHADRAAAPKDAEVYCIAPANAAKLHGPVTVKLGLKGMGIAPAGVGFHHTGHHHLRVDTPLRNVNRDQPLPASDHFGKDQTETTVTPTPGSTHPLELLCADLTHTSLAPALHSPQITITGE